MLRGYKKDGDGPVGDERLMGDLQQTLTIFFTMGIGSHETKHIREVSAVAVCINMFDELEKKRIDAQDKGIDIGKTGFSTGVLGNKTSAAKWPQPVYGAFPIFQKRALSRGCIVFLYG